MDGLMKTLRTDQTEAIENLRGAMRETRRVVVSGPTGMGKTVILADIVSRAREKDKKTLITVPAISLVDQTVIALAAQGIMDVGVIQAQHPMTDWSRPVQVASIQTLQHRWKERKMPSADLVLVDEVHRWFKIFPEWMLSPDWLKVPFIGFSATPWTKGLGRLYEQMITANNIKALIDAKVLVSFRTFAPDMPDLTGVRSAIDTTGVTDFVAADLDEIMRPKKLVANIVKTWLELAQDRPTVCFCCSRAHADQLTKEFNEATVGAAYLDCDTPLSERNEVRRRMLAGDVQVVCNVDVIGLGVDWPEVSCIVYARPTMSDIRFVQNVGRGLRAAGGKEDLLILDHSTTTARLGFVDEIYGYHPTLDDGKTKVPVQAVLLPKECPACHLMKPPRVAVCPHCGHKVEQHVEAVAVERGTLREIKPGEDMALLRKQLPGKEYVFGQLVWYGRKKGYNQWWPNMKFKDIYGVTFPRLQYEDKITSPCPELMTYIFDSTEKWKSKQNYARRKAQRKTNGNGHGNGHDSGALSEREQAIIDRARDTLMKDEDWEEMR
jgi:superfamily II DNA or RNA helicase